MKLDVNNLLNLAEQIVSYSKSKAKCEAQVTISSGIEFTAEIREQKIEKLVEAGSKGISLKVIVDNKVATASTSDFKEQTILDLVDNAIKRAQYTSKDDFAVLPPKEVIKISEDKLKIYDPNILKVSPEKKIKLAMELEKIAMADKRITVSSGAWCGTYASEEFLANSNGFVGSYKSSVRTQAFICRQVIQIIKLKMVGGATLLALINLIIQKLLQIRQFTELLDY
jgi:PmbA protein